MKVDEIEDRLALFRTRGPSPAFRARVLADARGEWIRRTGARIAFWRFVLGWTMALVTVVLLCAVVSWREESLTGGCFVARNGMEEASERVLSALCAEVGLDHSYAARWAFVSRERRNSGSAPILLWREPVIQ